MKILNLKNYRYFPGIWFLVTGLILFVMLFSPMRNIGIVLISIALIYVAIASYSNLSGSNNWKFRSRTRDQILKDQYKDKSHTSGEIEDFG